MAKPDLNLKVTVTFEAVQDSLELQNLLRQLIRQELIYILESVKAEEIQDVSND